MPCLLSSSICFCCALTPTHPPLFSLNHIKDSVLEAFLLFSRACSLSMGTMQDQHHHHHRARRPQAAAAALLLLVACLVQCLPTVHSFVGVGSRALWTLQHAGTSLRYDPFEPAERGQNISLTGFCPSRPSPSPLSTHTTTSSQRHASAPQRARGATTCSAIAPQTGQKSSKVKEGEIRGVRAGEEEAFRVEDSGEAIYAHTTPHTHTNQRA